MTGGRRGGRSGEPRLLPIRAAPHKIELTEEFRYAFRVVGRSRQLERVENRSELSVTVLLDDLLASARADLALLLRGKARERLARLGWLALSGPGSRVPAEALGAGGAAHAIPLDLPLAGSMERLEERAEQGERLTWKVSLDGMPALPPPIDLTLGCTPDSAAPPGSRPSSSLARFFGRMEESENGNAALHLGLRLRLMGSDATAVTARLAHAAWKWPAAAAPDDFHLSPEGIGTLYVDGARGEVVVAGLPIELRQEGQFLVGEQPLKLRLRRPSQLDGRDTLTGHLQLLVDGVVPSGRRLDYFDATGRPTLPGRDGKQSITYRTKIGVEFVQPLTEPDGPRLVERQVAWPAASPSLGADRLVPALLRAEGWTVEPLESGEEPRLRRWWAVTDAGGIRLAIELLLERSATGVGEETLTLQAQVRGPWRPAARRLERLEQRIRERFRVSSHEPS